MSTNETEKTKAEKFAEDPSKFFHQDEIIMAVIRGEKGLMVCHGACTRQDMEQALTRLNYRTHLIFQTMDMQNAMKEEKSIITPNGNGHGIMNFARRKK